MSYFVLMAYFAIGVHFQIEFSQAIIYQKLHYPTWRVNLTLDAYFVVFCFIATGFVNGFFVVVVTFVKPTEYIIALPD